MCGFNVQPVHMLARTVVYGCANFLKHAEEPMDSCKNHEFLSCNFSEMVSQECN